MSTLPPSSANELLSLWERTATVAPAGRDDALLAAAYGDAPASLGARNAALFGLRSRLLGPSQPLRCNCPDCAAWAEFSVDCDVLAQALAPKGDAPGVHRLDTDGHRLEFRVPDIEDVRSAAVAEAFGPALVRLCVTRCEREDGAPCTPDSLPEAVAEALSQRLEELEPGASVTFDLACPECAARWSASMDVGQVLWAELQSRAERLLLEVDALARAYGWSEAQVLALSPTRRAAYLQLVGAA